MNKSDALNNKSSSKRRKYYWIIPQFFTALRLVLSPVVAYCLLSENYSPAFWLTLVGGWSDWADGWSARYWKVSTIWGSIFDPIADKIFMSTIFICIAINNLLPKTVVAIFLIRDVMLIGGSLLQLKSLQLTAIKASLISKLNTSLQILLILLVIGAKLTFFDGFNTTIALKLLMWVCVLTTIISGIHYLWLWINKTVRKK